MAMSIQRCQHTTPVDDHEHDHYIVTFFDYTIITLVTDLPYSVDMWISEIKRIYRHRLHSLVVGLDVEWRPNRIPNHRNPVATLQLCVGRRCMIFQILNSPTIPRSLRNLLRNPAYTFTGVGIDNDAEKLMEDYNLEVANTADLGVLAAEEYGMRNLRNAGLIRLTRRVLGKELIKPEAVTMSRWDNESLTPAQVQYACIDAFLSYKIGKNLISRNLN